MTEEILLAESLTPGTAWSYILKRGTAITLTDVGGDANVSALFLHFDSPLERYNMPDTLKAQFIAYLTQGNVLFSDMGRILVSITTDTCGWHDTLGGHTDAAMTEAKYGATSYQKDQNLWLRNGRDNFLVELGKFGLGKKDMPVNINFFSKVMVDHEGNMLYQPHHSKPSASITLRAEMNVLVILSNTPHPMNSAKVYPKSVVELKIKAAAPVAANDACRIFRPENSRGFINTESMNANS